MDDETCPHGSPAPGLIAQSPMMKKSPARRRYRAVSFVMSVKPVNDAACCQHLTAGSGISGTGMRRGTMK